MTYTLESIVAFRWGQVEEISRKHNGNIFEMKLQVLQNAWSKIYKNTKYSNIIMFSEVGPTEDYLV